VDGASAARGPALPEAIGCVEFSGSLTSGGSAANLMALAMAREARAPANEQGAQPCVAYASEEVHMSIPKAIAMLGIGRANLHLVPVDAGFRIDLGELEAAIATDGRTGRRGIAVVATAGTITTGAIDPLAKLAEIARANDLWLHIDGAYGALAALADPAKLDGLSRSPIRSRSTRTSGCTNRSTAVSFSTEMPTLRGGPSRTPVTTRRR
jgi:aromatic-L-amino-acid decarboxylase